MRSRILAAFRPRPRSARNRYLLMVEQLEERSLLSASVGIHLLASANDPKFLDGSLWGISKIKAPAAWDTTTGSLKTVVADIDTGIDYTHPDLYKNVWINQDEIPATQKANILAHDDGDGLITFWDLNSGNVPWGPDTIADANTDGLIDAEDVLAGWDNDSDTDSNGYADDLVGWNFIAGNNNPFDDNGHGTHTAGTIGAIGNNGVGVVGVNWQVQIMPLKILDAKGGGNLDDAADAINYARVNGAKVSNNSWGIYDSAETVAGTKYNSLYAAIDGPVGEPKVLFVAAAGNNNLNNDTHWARNYPSSYNLDNIIAVAATTVKDTKANFSNYGKTTVDLGAPGHNVLSTVPGGAYAYYSGTSMATPHVAGAAALILAKNASLDAGAIKTAIVSSVTKLSSMSKTVSGGRLDVYGALASVNAGSSATASSSDSGESASAPPAGRGGNGARIQISSAMLPVVEQRLSAQRGDPYLTINSSQGYLGTLLHAGPRLLPNASPSAQPPSLPRQFQASLLSQGWLAESPSGNTPLEEEPAQEAVAPMALHWGWHNRAHQGPFVSACAVEDASSPDSVPEPMRCAGNEGLPRVESSRVQTPNGAVESESPAWYATAFAKSFGKVLGLAGAVAFLVQGCHLRRSRRKSHRLEENERAAI